MSVEADAFVFDAEPLVAHADDEPGAERTADYIDAVAAEHAEGYLTRINATEIRYVLARKYDADRADRYLQWLSAVGLAPIGADELWASAADWILAHNPALGDAYALAAAELTGATLLVGADADFDSVDDVTVERIRDGGV